MAKRYGCLPSVLAGSSIKEYQFNVLVAGIAINEEVKAQKKAIEKQKAARRR